ncbi:hypothetical protein [Devosia sp.]|uniref:hypothetical protein n=1 Tax=Devosia sp. TaxID=1871048 RepID=UPI0019E249CD|nr:hypothetical protein [Devosia sp.]MBE0580001.1 hypothetical protein [Devosia sp.]
MRYTQSQIRELLSISVDTFRTWRDAIPALSGHRGHAPSFMPGDVVALAIVAELVNGFGVRIGTLSSQFEQLFEACHGKSWPLLENCVVLITASNFRILEASVAKEHWPSEPTLRVSCAPIIVRLRSALAEAAADQMQGHLPFLPTSAATQPNLRGKRA